MEPKGQSCSWCRAPSSGGFHQLGLSKHAEPAPRTESVWQTLQNNDCEWLWFWLSSINTQSDCNRASKKAVGAQSDGLGVVQRTPEWTCWCDSERHPGSGWFCQGPEKVNAIEKVTAQPFLAKTAICGKKFSICTFWLHTVALSVESFANLTTSHHIRWS